MQLCTVNFFLKLPKMYSFKDFFFCNRINAYRKKKDFKSYFLSNITKTKTTC